MTFRLPTTLAIAFGIALAADAVTVTDKYAVDTEVCDPVLIYTGGLAKRATWNRQNLTPYITHLYADGTRDWFYDTFIFNETIRSCARGNVVLGNSSGGQIASLKEDWVWWLDHVFGRGHDLHVLDRVISEQKQTLGEPRLRHKVIIGTCAPCKDGSNGGAVWADINWGEIDGVKMDFSKRADRLKAACWMVDQIKERFEAQNYENIDLAGIYWIEESLFSNADIIADVNDHIRSIGLRSYWIPYWDNNDEYALNGMDRYHFDMVWRQPNYFFYERDGKTLPPKSQLIECIESSKRFGLGLELEFETSGTSNGLNNVAPKLHQRLIDYIDEFERLGVWDDSGVAHYGGSKGYIDMLNSGDAVNQATMDRLAGIVKKRQLKFAQQSSGIEDITAPEARQFAYASQGKIFITSDAPDAMVYTLAGVPVFYGNGLFECKSGLYIVTDGQGRSVKLAVK